jgi:hypothetical protein
MYDIPPLRAPAVPLDVAVELPLDAVAPLPVAPGEVEPLAVDPGLVDPLGLVELEPVARAPIRAFVNMKRSFEDVDPAVPAVPVAPLVELPPIA